MVGKGLKIPSPTLDLPFFSIPNILKLEVKNSFREDFWDSITPITLFNFHRHQEITLKQITLGDLNLTKSLLVLVYFSRNS
jgi:hypothetical protein